MITTPVVLVFIFTLNYFIPLRFETENYPVKSISNYSFNSTKGIVIELEDFKYENDLAFRTILRLNNNSLKGRKTYRIDYSVGLFGIRMYEFQSLKN